MLNSRFGEKKRLITKNLKLGRLEASEEFKEKKQKPEKKKK